VVFHHCSLVQGPLCDVQTWKDQEAVPEEKLNVFLNVLSSDKK